MDDDDCDGRIDESDSPDCDTGELGQCGLGTEICENGQSRCVPGAEPECENADNQVDEDCDGQSTPGAVAECSPADTQLSRVCIPDLFPSFYGFSMLLDGDDIVFTLGPTV